MNGDTQTWLQLIVSILIPVVSTVVPLLLGWVAVILKQKYNIELEAKDQTALHSAILTGITAALAKVANRGAPSSEIISQAIDHANASVPDALKRLKPSTEVLVNIAHSKMKLLEQQATPAVTAGAGA
jgi:hypothetical protein